MHHSRKNLLLATLGLVALGASTGCISSSETVYTDAPRAAVTFASDKAGRVFYETLARTPDSGRRTENRVSVDLILIDVEKRTIAGPNRRFNEAVAMADSDKDGTITDTEAEIFATAWPAARG
jgi:hypothetical protein